MLCRPYRPEDFAVLYAIEEACFEPEFRFPRRYMRQLVGRSSAAAWIAEENSVMAGFAVLGWSTRGGATVAYIETIEVLAEHRGQGIGDALLTCIEKSACEAHGALIWLLVDAENAGAIRLYEANGYTQAGREENFYPQGRAALIYQKPLAGACNSE